MPSKKHDKFYKSILILIAVLSLLGSVGDYIQPVFITRLDAAEKDIQVLNSQYSRIEAKLDKIMFLLPKN